MEIVAWEVNLPPDVGEAIRGKKLALKSSAEQPSLQCIQAAFPRAMHMLSTGYEARAPCHFSVSAQPVQVWVEIG